MRRADEGGLMPRGPRWTEAEIEMLKRGENPPGRTTDSCYIMRGRLGISTKKARWTETEIEMLKAGIVPEGRTFASCYCKGSKIHHSFIQARRRPSVKSAPIVNTQDIFAWQREMILKGLKNRLKG